MNAVICACCGDDRSATVRTIRKRTAVTRGYTLCRCGSEALAASLLAIAYRFLWASWRRSGAIEPGDIANEAYAYALERMVAVPGRIDSVPFLLTYGAKLAMRRAASFTRLARQSDDNEATIPVESVSDVDRTSSIPESIGKQDREAIKTLLIGENPYPNVGERQRDRKLAELRERLAAAL